MPSRAHGGSAARCGRFRAPTLQGWITGLLHRAVWAVRKLGAAAAAVTIGTFGIAAPAIAATFNGTSGDDNIRGTESSDSIRGFAGDDTLDGRGGGDFVSGDAGDDSVDGSGGSDLLAGGLGNDFIRGQADADRLFGERGQDFIKGGVGDDRLTGGKRDDTLVGGNGDDRLVPGAGSDQVFGGEDSDTVILTVDGNARNASSADFIDCGDGNDFVVLRDGQVDPRDTIVNCEKSTDPPRTKAPFRFAERGFVLAPANGTSRTEASGDPASRAPPCASRVASTQPLPAGTGRDAGSDQETHIHVRRSHDPFVGAARQSRDQ